MIELYNLQLYLDYDARKPMDRMLILDRFMINQHKFNNSLGTLDYHYNPIILPNMAYKMLIESS